MAVTRTSAIAGRNSSGDITIASVVVASGDNGILVLSSVQDGNHANYPVVSMVRDGQSFTKIVSYEPAGNIRVEGWYLASPNVNTADIVIDLTGSLGESTACAFVVSGADSSSMIDDYDGGSGSGFAPDITSTTTMDNEMIFCVLCAEADITASGQTTQQDYQDQSYENTFYSYRTAPTAGSYTISHSMASGQPYAQLAVAIKSTETPRPPRLLIKGVSSIKGISLLKAN